MDPTVLYLRAVRRFALNLLEMYGCEADPRITELIAWLNERIPPDTVPVQQEVDAVAAIHRQDYEARLLRRRL